MKSFFSVVFVLLYLNVFSQTNDNMWKGERGRVIFKQNNEIKGKDYIYDEWNRGMLVLNDSVFSKQDYLQYDAFKNRVLIKNLNDHQEIMEINDRSLTGFSIFEREGNMRHDFVRLSQNNFATEADAGFYEIVFNLESTNYFIKKNSKEVYDPNRSKGSQTINNLPLEYKDKTTYYIKNSNGLFVKTRLKKKEVSAILNEHKKLVNAYLKTNKIKFNKEQDVAQLVNYYYSL